MKVADLSAVQAGDAAVAGTDDVVTSLASGMPGLMVAIQQGGQITDSSGYAGETRALGEKIKSFFGLTSSVNAGGILAVGEGLVAASMSNRYCRWGRQCQRRLH